ncbi:hypothetical protein ENSA7_42290 [Enhygromyxa salina]|uniref:Uncharacterized protein n=1 Tax=Enhygromyxa salina TaxID=215803 RepID=A0A2S9YLV5_9BACT|nr:hypothetical protein ENSA7_42290 [Enhygromyxa salina]
MVDDGEQRTPAELELALAQEPPGSKHPHRGGLQRVALQLLERVAELGVGRNDEAVDLAELDQPAADAGARAVELALDLLPRGLDRHLRLIEVFELAEHWPAVEQLAAVGTKQRADDLAIPGTEDHQVGRGESRVVGSARQVADVPVGAAALGQVSQ